MNSTSSSVDLGPLSWVKTEIEHSLAEARTNLDKLAVDASDSKALKFVATHLHQVTGALSMVGLGAATRFSEEIEALVSSLEDPGAKSLMKERVTLAKQATGSLSGYLDSLMVGEPDRPMALAPAYLALNRGRGDNQASESDLFSPDLTVVVPVPEDTVALPKSDMLTEAIKQRRSLYQAGLLKLLREKDLVAGARDMRNATLAIEALQVTSPTRAFWYTASGFFDAVASNPGESGALAVQLFGKIDQQIKLLIEGVQKVPERLFRDLLLVIGKSRADTERVRKIRTLYRLDELLAAAPERDFASDETVRTLVRSLRDLVQASKENWLKFTSGNRAALEAFIQQGEAQSKYSQGLPNAAMAELIRVLGLVGPHLKKTGVPPSEVQALEVASALLFVESSLENFSRLSPEFQKQTQGIVARIKGAMSGTALPALDASTNAMMDDFTKRAQERLLMFQVGQEVQVNLSTIESTLDGFFRDPVKMSDLASLPPLFSQVQGALAILELDEAAALNQMLRDRVSQFASGAVKGTGDEAEAVAEGVSALGLFVSALQQSAADPRSVLLPALIRFGLAEKPPETEKSQLKSPVSDADLEINKQKVQVLYEDWKQQPEATTTRDQLREAVKELKQDAEVAGDLAAAKSSEATLKALESSFDPMKTGITEAIADIAPAKPAEAPAPQVVQLLDAPAADIDQELLDIFLEEATEVVATIQEQLALVRVSPHDREALTTIRRGFHTLKGSGRMVGLNDLGEVAWSCEQVMNKWLKDDKPASPGLMKLIDDAAIAFGGWVSLLQTAGTAAIDGTRINELCELLKNDKEPVLEVVAAPVVEPEAAVFEPAVEEAVAAPESLSIADEFVAPPAEVVAIPELDLPSEPAVLEQIAEPVELAVAPEMFEATEVVEVVESVETPAGLPLTVSNAPDDVFAELPALAATEAPPALEVSAPVEDAVVEAEDADVQIGDVVLPKLLYEIYIGEASSHIETLDREMAGIEAHPMNPVSHEFMRAAHTLTSSSRTTGFDAIADVAFALEKWLQDAIELVPEWNQERLQETRQAVDVLAGMVLALHTMQQPEVRPDVVTNLVALRESLKAGARIGEGTHLKAPHAQAESISPLGSETAEATESSELDSIFGVSETLEPASAPAAPAEAISFDFLADTPVTPAAAVEASASAEETASVPALDFDAVLTATDLPAVSSAEVVQPVTTLEPDDTAPAGAAAPAEPAFEATRVFEIASTTAMVAAASAFAETNTTTDATEISEVSAATSAEEAAFFDDATEAASDAVVETVVETPLPAAPETDFALPAVEEFVVPSEVPAPVVTPEFQSPTPTLEVAPVVVTSPTSAFAPAPVMQAVVEEAAFEAGKDRRAVKDDIDVDLLPIFLEEAKELLPQVGDALRRWRGTAGDHSPVGELARHLHTLKGSARMAGLMRLGELAHVMETRIIDMDKLPEPSAGEFEAIDDRLDRFNIALDALGAGDLAPTIEIPVESAVAAAVPAELPSPMAAIAAARAEIVAEGEKLEGRERQALLRVNADLIDRFVNEAGELAIARSRVDLELQAFKKALLDLSENVSRMKQQLREIEIGAESQIQSRTREAEAQGEQFDPLEFDRFSRMQELTRFMAESLNDVVTLQQSLAKNLDEADAALLQQGRLNRDLQQGLMGVRLVPLGNLQDRFYRLVRQTAKELEKKTNLEFRGVRVEIDRSVLEKITAPFEHLLRNAVAHGIEMPADRAAKGKSETGEISIDARQIGNEVLLTLSDDGDGLNFARIREKAIEKGMLAPDADVTDAQLTQLIFAAGFSTADTISQVAGRGVGMDVVRNEIVSLGGRIDIASAPGKGTTFTIALPLTLAVTQAVMVTVGETTYAIPSVMIEQVQEYKGKRYEPLLEMNEVEWKGNKYPLRSMEVILGGKPRISATRRAFVVLAKSGQQRAAVQVDDIIGNREIVVKSIGPQLARIPGIAGATVMGSGQVVLIMNPVQLVFREAATVSIEQSTTVARTGAPLDAPSVQTTEEVQVPAGPTLAEAIAANTFDDSGFMADESVKNVRTSPLVMVVDDSLTVRKITSRMLIREGFEVATAKDGVDGLQQLQDIDPDIILLDIEMPRMDGFEFARNVRADAKAKHIPIIMITSRTADKHRNHAMELGVNEYMGKPYQEEQLLALIRQYTRQRVAA